MLDTSFYLRLSRSPLHYMSSCFCLLPVNVIDPHTSSDSGKRPIKLVARSRAGNTKWLLFKRLPHVLFQVDLKFTPVSGFPKDKNEPAWSYLQTGPQTYY